MEDWKHKLIYEYNKNVIYLARELARIINKKHKAQASNATINKLSLLDDRYRRIENKIRFLGEKIKHQTNLQDYQIHEYIEEKCMKMEKFRFWMWKYNMTD